MKNVLTEKKILNLFWLREVGLCLFAGVVCLLFTLQLNGLWSFNWNIPINYYFGGDAFLNLSFIKGIVENGLTYQNQYLAAPIGWQPYDFPFYDFFHLAIFKIASIFFKEYPIIFNLNYIITFPLTCLSALYVFRRYQIPYFFSLAGSLIFAFLPSNLWEGQVHSFNSTYYLIPLSILVFLRISQGTLRLEDLSPKANLRNPKIIFSMGVFILVGLGSVYYSFFSAYFLLIAAGLGFSQTKNVGSLKIVFLLVLVLMLSVVLNYLPTLIYSLQNGSNQILPQRHPIQAEWFSFKISQMLFPVTGHRLAFLMEFKQAFNSVSVNYNFQNDIVSLGIIGSMGTLFLLLALIYIPGGIVDRKNIQKLAVFNVFAILLGTVGGIGSIIAYAIYPILRCYGRVSVYIGFFSIFGMLILLREIFLGLTSRGYILIRKIFSVVVVVAFIFGIYDESSPVIKIKVEENKKIFEEDSQFAKILENILPQNSKVFQLPYVPFPEGAEYLNKMKYYSPLIPYLHSHGIHWSFGGIVGRPQDQWQREISGYDPIVMNEKLLQAGFRGIFLDRYGYPDSGAKIEGDLEKALQRKPLVSQNQRWSFFRL